MNVRLPFVQVFILIVFSSFFSFLLNGLRSNGIPLLAKELAVHIKGAWNIPFFFELMFKLDSLQGKDSPVVLYCSGDECGSSEDLAYELQGEGFTNLYVFKGGWTKWSENGHPIGP